MNKPVVVCIGSSNVTGDSLGPLVGDRLIFEYNADAYVYGCSVSPVHGGNFSAYLEHIKIHHRHSLVIAVDACVGKAHDVGSVKYTLGGIKAGGALNKGLEKIGDIGILGIVAAAERDNFKALMAVDENFVVNMSARIAESVYKLLRLHASNLKTDVARRLSAVNI